MQLSSTSQPVQSYTVTCPVINRMPMVENVSCVFPQSQELGGLFIGNFMGAQNVDMLKERGIRAVLTTSVETRMKLTYVAIMYATEHIPFHKRIQAHDRHNFSIGDHFQDCLEFIEQCRKLTNVYVHCYAGVSRSASIVIAYIMKSQKWSYETALNFLRHKRTIVHPNEGFATQLRQFQKKLNLKNNHTFTQRSVQSANLQSKGNMMEGPVNSGHLGLYHKQQRNFGVSPMISTSLNVSANVLQGNSTSNNIARLTPKAKNFTSLTQDNGIYSPSRQQNKSCSRNSRQKRQQLPQSAQNYKKSVNIEAFTPNISYTGSSTNIKNMPQNQRPSVSSANNIPLQAKKQSQQGPASMQSPSNDRKINFKDQSQTHKISMARKEIRNAYKGDQPTLSSSNAISPSSSSTPVSLKSLQQESSKNNSVGLIRPKNLPGYRQG